MLVLKKYNIGWKLWVPEILSQEIRKFDEFIKGFSVFSVLPCFC